MAFPPNVLVTSFIASRLANGTAVARRSRIRPGHVDNPRDRVKFCARQDGRDHVANEKSSRSKGDFDGGCRRANLAQELE
jgi:hypothetical protein